jgi:DNA-binding HxlR family transcriptional regulator
LLFATAREYTAAWLHLATDYEKTLPGRAKAMKRKTLENADCPLARPLEAVGDAWSVLIVRQAFAGGRRFGEFKRSLGVARNTRIVRLRKLVALGILEQIPEGDGSPYHDDALTEKGRGLFLVLMALRQWGEAYGGESRHVLVDRRARKPVRPLAFHAHDGRELSAGEMELVPAAGRRGRAGGRLPRLLPYKFFGPTSRRTV